MRPELTVPRRKVPQTVHAWSHEHLNFENLKAVTAKVREGFSVDI